MNVEITIWGVTCVIARLKKMQFELFKLVCWCFVSCRMLLSPHCWKSPGIFWLRSGTLWVRFNQFIVVFISRERRIFAFIRRERIVRLMTLSHVSRDVWPELPALPGNQFRLEVSSSQHCFNQMWRASGRVWFWIGRVGGVESPENLESCLFSTCLSLSNY